MTNNENISLPDRPKKRVGQILLSGAVRIFDFSPHGRTPRPTSPEEAMRKAIARTDNVTEEVTARLSEVAIQNVDIEQPDEGIKGE